MAYKVLVVDDNTEIQDVWQDQFAVLIGRDLTYVRAETIEDARRLFAEHADLDLIVMDGAVPGTVLNTVPLVRDIRLSFKGPIIAASTLEGSRRQLIEAGCTHQVSSKADVGPLAEKILRLLRGA